MNILSLFANIGVAEAYLKENGFNVLVANEIDSKRCAIYRSIYKDCQMICGDITNDNTKDIILKTCDKKIDIIMATPPCQGMSTAGKCDPEDIRNRLFLYALDIINILNPKYFLFENVPAFMTTTVDVDGKGNVKLIPDAIKEIVGNDYTMTFNQINTKDYEVPQMRERVIVLGTRKDIEKKWLMPAPSSNIVTMEDAIGWIPIIDPMVRDIPYEEFIRMFPYYEERKEAALKISPWNIPTSHVLRQVIAMQHTPTGASAFSNPVYKPRKKDGTIVRGFLNTYKRQNWNMPAYTIAMDNIEISSQNNVHPGRFIGQDENGDDIYSDPRALTIYELMKLMTIPDDWPIPLTTDKRFLRRVIGEGVPSLLIKKIFNQLK